MEVDGPSHFLSSSSTHSGSAVLDGSTALKNRLLSARGWMVVSVPVEEWGRLPQQGDSGDAASAVVGSGGEGREAVGGGWAAGGLLLTAQQRYCCQHSYGI